MKKIPKPDGKDVLLMAAWLIFFAAGIVLILMLGNF